MTRRDWRLAVDIGGTFTDVVLLDAVTGAVVVEKVLTTPSAPLDGVRHGVSELLRRAEVRPADITAPIVHATTLITNALIEAKAGRAAMVATAGFGDTMLIRDEHRYDMYDLPRATAATHRHRPISPRSRKRCATPRSRPSGCACSTPTSTPPTSDWSPLTSAPS